MWNKLQHGEPFSETATHATQAVATKAAASGKQHCITGIAVSSDKAGAICLVKSGTTVIWQQQIGDVGSSNTAHYEQTFPIPLVGDDGALVSVEVDGTSACKANIVGATIK